MQSILIIRLSSLGDVILATALVRQISLSIPNASIDVAVDARFQDVWRHNPRVRRVFAIDRSVRTSDELAKGALQAPYDLIVDLQKNRRSRQLIDSFAPARGARVVSVSKHRLEKILLVHMKIRPKRVVSIMERYWQTVRPFGIQWDDLGPEVWTAEGAATSAGLRSLIGIAPGARHATKRWPVEGFAELARYLVLERQQQVVLLGGPDDVALCDQIASVSGVGLLRADGAPDLSTTVTAIDQCRAVVSNDSAVMHLARSRKIPVVAIFGSTVRELGFAPVGNDVRIVERPELSCRPCSHIGRDHCPKGHFSCMRLITSTEVVSAIDELLGA